MNQGEKMSSLKTKELYTSIVDEIIKIASNIESPNEKAEILNAIKKAFTSDFSDIKNPYEGENTSETILSISPPNAPAFM